MQKINSDEEYSNLTKKYTLCLPTYVVLAGAAV